MLTYARLHAAIIRLYEPAVLLHILLTLVPAGFGLTLALPGHTFEISHTYSVMAKLFSEGQWAGLGLATAALGLAAWINHRRWAMLLANMVLLFWHGMVALCLWLASPASTGTLTYAALALVATIRLWGLAYHYALHR